MKFRTPNEHKIDLVFPIAVFFVFAASALAVLMLAARIYGSQTEDAGNNYTTSASLAYVNEKIRQSDADGGISIKTLEGARCLALESRTDEVSYTTYIYEQEGMLKELFIRNDVKAQLSDGRNIMEVKDFEMDEIGEGLFRFTSVSADGSTAVLIASERSVP